MKRIRRYFAVSLLILLAASSAAWAHHGSASYDVTRTISIKGEVTQFQFVNPHALISLDVKDESGNVQPWQGELTSPNRLTRLGWSKNSLKPGDSVALSGYPTKSGARQIWIQKVFLANGDELPTSSEN